MQRENKEDPRLESNGLAINPSPEAIYMQRENKWQDRFEKLYKTLGYKDELSFEEIPPDIQLKQFIQSEIDIERERINKFIKEWHKDSTCVAHHEGQECCIDWLLKELSVDNPLDTQNK